MMGTELPPEFVQYKSTDPFPKISSGLLNSADIADYVNTVKIFDPFILGNLKTASYELPFSGSVFWWDPETKQQIQKQIKSKDNTFALKPNSIAYVQPDTTFYLPDYIALRFNLRITHVHQGLLLGTGPLVDPGFCGRLLIPLHNLTANEYVFVYGNGFIWIDFTKLSPNARWNSTSFLDLPRKGSYKPFPDNKKFLTPESYFRQANEGSSIVSSIPEAIKQSKDDASTAAKNAASAADSARKAGKKLDRNLIVGLVAVLLTVFAAGIAIIQIFQSTLDSKTRASEEVTKAQIEGLRQELNQRRSEAATKTQVDGLQEQINKLRIGIEQGALHDSSSK